MPRLLLAGLLWWLSGVILAVVVVTLLDGVFLLAGWDHSETTILKTLISLPITLLLSLPPDLPYPLAAILIWFLAARRFPKLELLPRHRRRGLLTLAFVTAMVYGWVYIIRSGLPGLGTDLQGQVTFFFTNFGQRIFDLIIFTAMIVLPRILVRGLRQPLL